MSSPSANDWPWWVKVGLAQMIGKDARSRPAAIALFLGSLVVDLSFVVAGFLLDSSFFWLAAAFAVCSLWTLLAILWVDKRSRWPAQVSRS